jgi:hydroxyacylglutathione hydrolase
VTCFLRLETGRMGNLSYLLWDTAHGGAVLIDAGWDPAPARRALTERKLRAEALILTHGHYDHTAALPELRKAFPDAPVLLAAEDGFLLTPEAAAAGPFDSPEDGRRLRLGGTAVELIRTPGHSPGSLCCLAGDLLFTGDTLFAGACGRADLPGSDPEALLRSLRKLGALPPSTRVFPGHSYNASETTIGAELASNPCLRAAVAGDKAAFLGEI